VIDDPIFERATEVYKSLKDRCEAQKSVSQALDDKDRKKLKLAITEAEKLGLDMELKAARDYLRRLAAANTVGKDGEEFDEASQPLEYLPLRTGALMKRGVGFPYRWQARHVTLEETALTYFEQDERTKQQAPKGVIMCEWVEARHGKGKFQFLIGGDHKNIKFEARSLEDRDSWIKSICTNVRVRSRNSLFKHFWQLVSQSLPRESQIDPERLKAFQLQQQASMASLNAQSDFKSPPTSPTSATSAIAKKLARPVETPTVLLPLNQVALECFFKLVYVPPDMEVSKPTKTLYHKFMINSYFKEAYAGVVNPLAQANSLEVKDLVEINEGEELQMAQDPLFTQAISVDFNKFVEKSMKLVKERGKEERAPSDFRGLVRAAIVPPRKNITKLMAFYAPILKANEGIISFEELLAGLRSMDNNKLCAQLGFGVYDMQDPERIHE